jgi:mRNA interferase MazF
MVIRQFGIYLVNLDPTVGSEIQKTRPCMVISPPEMNKFLNTVIIIPLTNTLKNYPTRVNCVFENKKGQLALDQLRAIDKYRILKQLGSFDEKDLRSQITSILGEMFSYTDR